MDSKPAPSHTPLIPTRQEELRHELQFQLSLMRLVHQGSLDGGPRLTPQIAQIEQQIEQLMLR